MNMWMQKGELMSDLISRQAAVTLILSGKVGDDSLVECPEECNSFLEWAAEAVGNMPSAERKKGKWILVKGSNSKDYHKCSQCLHTQEITGVKNYCAVCGAEMRRGEGG